MGHDSRSVLDRPAPPPDFTVSYGEHPEHICDVRIPRQGPPKGLVIFLHGGFWRSEFDRVHTAPLATALAEDGYVVANPEFRRTGMSGGGWPGTLDDVAAAVRAVPQLIADHLTTAPLVPILSGHSAGGHLALWAAATRVAPVGGVVALAPVADLGLAYELDLDEGAVRDLLGGAPTEVPGRYAAADPVGLVPVGVATVLVHGQRDRHVPIELSRRYRDAAAAAGDPVELVELSDTDHFAVIDPISAAWPAVVAVLDRVSTGEGRFDAREDSR